MGLRQMDQKQRNRQRRELGRRAAGKGTVNDCCKQPISSLHITSGSTEIGTDEFSEVTHLISAFSAWDKLSDARICQLPPSPRPLCFAFNALSIASNASRLVLDGRWTAWVFGGGLMREGHSDCGTPMDSSRVRSEESDALYVKRESS